jgi:hypothetical protein
VDAVKDAMAAGMGYLGKAAGLPELRWLWLTGTGYFEGYASADYSDAEVPAVLAKWAEYLGLTQKARPMSGTLEYGGHVAGVNVSVWGVVDRDAFEVKAP